MKRDVLMLAGALLAGLVGGAVSHQLFARGVSGYVQQEKVIRAERFELVDRDGKTGAVLGVGANGPSLNLYGSKGGSSYLYVDADGPRFSLMNSKGGSSSLSVDADGPRFSLMNSKGGSSSLSVRADGPSLDLMSFMRLNPGKGGVSSLNGSFIELQASPDGPRLSLDKDGKSRAVLDTANNGEPALKLADKDGKVRAMLWTHDGEPVLALSDKDGKSRIQLQAHTDGGPVLALIGKDDQPRAMLGSTRLKDRSTGSAVIRPPSSLVLFGEDGKVIWQAP